MTTPPANAENPEHRETPGNPEAPAVPLTVYGADWCGDCRRTTAQLRSLGVAFDYVDLVAQPERAREAQQISGRTNIPVVLYPDGTHQVEPSNLEVAAKLHLFGLA